MIDLGLAVRNLLRNRRRSLATLLALAIGTAAILLFGGYRKNIEYSMHTGYVRHGGHLQIQHRDLYLYGAGNPTQYAISNYKKVMAVLAGDEWLGRHVVVATPTLQLGGIASNASEAVSRTVVGVGVVAADYTRMRAWNGFDMPQIAPKLALDGAPSDAAIVGTGVARVLLLCQPLNIADCPKPLGKSPQVGADMPEDIARLTQVVRPGPAVTPAGKVVIDLLASGAGGAPNVVSLQVVGAERQGFKELDEIYVMLQLAQAQQLIFGRAEPKVTSIVLQLDRSSELATARERVKMVLNEAADGQPLAVLSFTELNPFFEQTVQLFDTIFGFIFVLISSIVLFTVSNTMNTAVMERTVEIGTLRALGVRRLGVQRLFVMEGLLLGLAGAATGAIFAIAVSAFINSLGLTWLPPGSGDRLPLLLLVWGETSTIVLTVVGLLTVAGVSAWWPARRASRLVIVDALRHA